MSNKICGIYGIFDAASDECLYIGQSKDVEYRWKCHLKNLKSGNHKRKDFCAWYNAQVTREAALRFELLEECKPIDSDLNELEIKWFEKSTPKFYGTVPSLNNRWGHSDETRQKIRESVTVARQNDRSPEHLLECKGCGTFFSTKKKDKVFCNMACFREYESSIISSIEKNVCKSYLSGLSLRKCESLYKVSYVTIRKILILNGIDRRSK